MTIRKSNLRPMLKSMIAVMFAAAVGLPGAAYGESNCCTPASTTPETKTSSKEVLTKYEKDRAAILAMAGQYEVAFHFRETVSLTEGYELKKPYDSVATEFIEVVEDEPGRIVLQHILVLGDGDDKRVIKHWRQDWTYEPTSIHEFRGQRKWVRRELSEAERKGKWAQIVYQVDDSPRYAGVGAWSHEHGQQAWESETWRPLPRREYTKRDDYHVMIARNRHILTADGWVHEQDNEKLVLNESGQASHVLAREFGLNKYVRTENVDFKAGYEYWSATQTFWAEVRAAWAELYAKHDALTVPVKIDEKPMYAVFFEKAREIAAMPTEERPDRKTMRDWIDTQLGRVVIGDQTKATASKPTGEKAGY